MFCPNCSKDMIPRIKLEEEQTFICPHCWTFVSVQEMYPDVIEQVAKELGIKVKE